MTLTIRRLILCGILASMLAVRLAHAGLFNDDEARERIEALKVQFGEQTTRIETVQHNQVDLSSQLEALRAEVALLRGQLEVLSYNFDSAQKRLQDFYAELDARLRKLETTAPSMSSSMPSFMPDDLSGQSGMSHPMPSPSDPAKEMRDYEAALNLLKEHKYGDAVNAFAAFITAHPSAALAPSAQYWLGNAYQLTHECQKAIEAHQVIIARWPDHAKVPDAFLNIGVCQQELGDDVGAKKTLDNLVAKYPQSPAAQTARKLLLGQ